MDNILRNNQDNLALNSIFMGGRTHYSIVKSFLAASSRMFFVVVGIASALWAGSMLTCRADGTKPPATGELYNYEGDAGIGALKPSEGATASVVDLAGTKMVKVDFTKVDDYPGVSFPVPTGGWDLSGFTGVQVTLNNPGADTLKVTMSVVNEGDWQAKPFSATIIAVAPGETKTLKVVFGQAFGQAGFKLDPAHVIAVKVFVQEMKHPFALLIGKPTVYEKLGE